MDVPVRWDVLLTVAGVIAAQGTVFAGVRIAFSAAVNQVW